MEYIGVSKLSTLMGMNKYSTYQCFILEKVSDKLFNKKRESNINIKKGILFEKITKNIATKLYNVKNPIDSVKYKKDNIICIPDMIDHDNKIVFEFKNPKIISEGKDIPDHYKPQVYTEMEILGEGGENYRSIYMETSIKLTTKKTMKFKHSEYKGVIYRIRDDSDINGNDNAEINGNRNCNNNDDFVSKLSNTDDFDIIKSYDILFDGQISPDEYKKYDNIYFYVENIKICDNTYNGSYIKKNNIIHLVSEFCFIVNSIYEYIINEKIDTTDTFMLQHLIINKIPYYKKIYSDNINNLNNSNYSDNPDNLNNTSVIT